MKNVTMHASVVAIALALDPTGVAHAATGGDALTIYSASQPDSISPEVYRHGGRGQAVPGYAVVRHERDLALERGRNTVRFTDVAALIDPTTVSFESLTDPKGTSVVEQNFQFDLVNTARWKTKNRGKLIASEMVDLETWRFQAFELLFLGPLLIW